MSRIYHSRWDNENKPEIIKFGRINATGELVDYFQQTFEEWEASIDVDPQSWTLKDGTSLLPTFMRMFFHYMSKSRDSYEAHGLNEPKLQGAGFEMELCGTNVTFYHFRNGCLCLHSLTTPEISDMALEQYAYPYGLDRSDNTDKQEIALLAARNAALKAMTMWAMLFPHNEIIETRINYLRKYRNGKKVPSAEDIQISINLDFNTLLPKAVEHITNERHAETPPKSYRPY